jgi:anti-sigma regulatory factor (Ser/Thr protein kinase)
VALTVAGRLAVEDQSQVATVRRAASSMAAGLGLSERLQAEAAIVATEMATNLLRHGGGGEVVLRPSEIFPDVMEVIAWDRGPGMADVAGSRRDGVSTVGGAGTGLGAIGRLSSTFDLQSTPGRGTVVAARIGAVDAPPAVDGIVLAMRGEEASGDAWRHVRDGRHLTIVLADGLGHGVDAARASRAATSELAPNATPDTLLERMHGALRPTRGAAAAVARVDLATGALRFAGVGNISATIVSGGTTRSLVSMNGTLGHNLRRIQGFDHELPPDALLVMHSDGVTGNWDLRAHPGITRRDPLVLASVLVRDCERGRDDVSVVVARATAEAPA